MRPSGSRSYHSKNNGGRGIRTPGTVSRTNDFKSFALNHSAIPPKTLRKIPHTDRALSFISFYRASKECKRHRSATPQAKAGGRPPAPMAPCGWRREACILVFPIPSMRRRRLQRRIRAMPAESESPVARCPFRNRNAQHGEAAITQKSWRPQLLPYADNRPLPLGTTDRDFPGRVSDLIFGPGQWDQNL